MLCNEGIPYFFFRLHLLCFAAFTSSGESCHNLIGKAAPAFEHSIFSIGIGFKIECGAGIINDSLIFLQKVGAQHAIDLT